MNELHTQVVTVSMPSGKPLRVQTSADADGMSSVGLEGKLDVDEAVNTVAELGNLIYSRLKSISPTKATVELTFGFSLEAGKLTALIVSGKAEAALTLTLEWSKRD